MTWDGTINLGTLISAFLVIAAIVGAAYAMKYSIKEAKDSVTEMKPSVSQIPGLVQDVAEMKPVVTQIHALVAADGAKQRQLDDHAERIKELERETRNRA